MIFTLLAACSEQSDNPAASAATGSVDDNKINILVFGDSGYQLGYVEQKYFDRPYKTREAYIESYRQDWLNKHKPIEDFREPLLEFHEASGSYMPASGQIVVANAMTEYCARTDCDFGVMLGDNIYPDGATLGADGVDDAKRFDDLLSAPYEELAALRDDFKVYATLGNHDWHTSREGAMAQVDYMRQHPMLYMSDLYYSVVPPNTGGEVEIFVVDTEMLLQTTPVKQAILNPDGSEKSHEEYKSLRASAIPQTEGEKSMVAWLESALSESKARYKIVMAHHPFWAAGGAKFEQARAIRGLIRPMVCQYADAVFAGHEHTLEAYTDDCSDIGVDRDKPVLHVVSGAAGKQRSIHSSFVSEQNKAYPQRQLLFAEGGLFGFAGVELEQGDLRLRLYRVELNGDLVDVFDYQL